MKKKIYLIASMFFLGSLFSGCEPADDSIIVNETNPVEVNVGNESSSDKLQDATLPSYFVSQLAKYETTILNTYSLTFLGREVKGTEEFKTTTFNYRVSGNGATPQMDSFFLEVPFCAGSLISWTPQNSTNLLDNAIKWNFSISKTGFQDYSVTYPGDISLGIVTAMGIRGGIEESTKILGPCMGVSILSGYVFIDADGDGSKEGGEFGLPGKSVTLNDRVGNEITTLLTDLEGFYSFMVLDGNYRISITEDYLDENYYGLGNSYKDLQNVAGNIEDLNFGYSVNSDNIIYDLENKILLNTQPTKFWLQEIRNAGRKNSLFTSQVVLDFLTAIEGRENSPFDFGTDKIGSAIAILGNPIKTPLEEFIQQLLTAELNVISGKGVQLGEDERKAFHEALLTYSEGVACRESNQCSANKAQTSSMEISTKLVSSRDTRMLSSFNGSGGL